MALVKTENVGNQFTGFGVLPAVRQLGLMIGLAASVALGVAVVMWSQTPSYKLLYNSLSNQDTAEVVGSLQQAGIEYKVDESTGTVWVPGADVHNARMQLASQGLPEGTGSGFELMDKEDGFGSSQFVESIRYQRALEGELARTIMTFKSVQSARVHLAVPKQSVFVRNRKMPSASVTVGLYPGRFLEPAQVQAIVNMVSSSVPNLESKQVTVVDQLGKLLTDDGDMMTGGSLKQLDYKSKLEKLYSKRIEALLTPIVGEGRIRAQVNTEIDFTFVEKTQESFNPDQPAVRSEQTSKETRSGLAGLAGVPGSLTNTPPPAGTLENVESEPAPASSSPQNSMQRSTRNYELDKTISHTKLAAGSLRRLSVAVLLDDKQSTVEGEEGETAPYTEIQIAQLTKLVKETIGFNARRGDSIKIINIAFTPVAAVEALPEPGLLEQDWVWDMGKQALGGLAVLLLVFGVLKPVLRELAQKGVDAKKAPQQQIGSDGLLLEGEDEQVTLSAQAAAQSIQQQSHDIALNAVTGMVDQDPKTVAQVLKNWVATDGG